MVGEIFSVADRAHAAPLASDGCRDWSATELSEERFSQFELIILASAADIHARARAYE